jgi:hypothetical protein
MGQQGMHPRTVLLQPHLVLLVTLLLLAARALGLQALLLLSPGLPLLLLVRGCHQRSGAHC